MAQGGFAAVVVTPDQSGAGLPDGAVMEIEIGGVARLRIPLSTPPALAASVVSALVAR